MSERCATENRLIFLSACLILQRNLVLTGVGAGAAGSVAGLGVCAAIGIATAGTGAVVCAAVGSIAAGYVGAKASDSVMDTIYEYMGI